MDNTISYKLAKIFFDRRSSTKLFDEFINQPMWIQKVLPNGNLIMKSPNLDRMIEATPDEVAPND